MGNNILNKVGQIVNNLGRPELLNRLGEKNILPFTPELGQLIRTLCETYSGREPLADVVITRADDVVDFEAFIADRETFVRWCGTNG